MNWLIHLLGGVTEAEADEREFMARRSATELAQDTERDKLAKSIALFEAAREAALLNSTPQPPAQVDPSWIRVWATWRGDPRDRTIRFFTEYLGCGGSGFSQLTIAETNLTRYEDFTLNRVRAIGVEVLPSDDPETDAAVRAVLQRKSTLRLERGHTNVTEIAPTSAFSLEPGPAPLLWDAPVDLRGGWVVQLVVPEKAKTYLPTVTIRLTVWVEPEESLIPALRKAWRAAAAAANDGDLAETARLLSETRDLLDGR